MKSDLNVKLTSTVSKDRRIHVIVIDSDVPMTNEQVLQILKRSVDFRIVNDNNEFSMDLN